MLFFIGNSNDSEKFSILQSDANIFLKLFQNVVKTR